MKAEQDAFEDWLAKAYPSGNCERVQEQWLESVERADYAIEVHDELAAEVERLNAELKSVTAQLAEADEMVQEMQGIIDGGAA